MKNDHGLTILKLSIIVLAVIILTVVCVITYDNSTKISELEKYVIEMQTIQNKVNLIRKKYTDWEGYNSTEANNFYLYLQSLNYNVADSTNNEFKDDFIQIINDLNKEDTKNWDSNTDSIITNYYYFTPQELYSYFGVKDKGLYVIINFYSGNVISKDGVYDIVNGKEIHRQYDASNGSELVSTKISTSYVPNIEVVENSGNKQKVKISLKSSINTNISTVPNIQNIYYYEDEMQDSRRKANDLKDYEYYESEKAAYFSISRSGNFNFVIEDSNFIEYTPIKYKAVLCNPPVLIGGLKGVYYTASGELKEIESSLDPNWYNYNKEFFKMANAVDEDGNFWVWVPRFIYNKTMEKDNILFVSDESNINTSQKSASGYEIHEAFTERGNTKGFWIAKYQANGNTTEKISVLPGKTLTVLSKENALYCIKNNINDKLKIYAELMSEKEKDACNILSKAYELKIATDLVYYAGGSPYSKKLVENIQFSNTNNIYGVFDLVTSENELVNEDTLEKTGRYRPVLILK